MSEGPSPPACHGPFSSGTATTFVGARTCLQLILVCRGSLRTFERSTRARRDGPKGAINRYPLGHERANARSSELMFLSLRDDILQQN